MHGLAALPHLINSYCKKTSVVVHVMHAHYLRFHLKTHSMIKDAVLVLMTYIE